MKDQAIHYLGLDVHQAMVVATSRNESGAIVLKATVPTEALVILGVWRHVYKRFPLTYSPLYWGAVFPLGMYNVCTFPPGAGHGGAPARRDPPHLRGDRSGRVGGDIPRAAAELCPPLTRVTRQIPE